jgi:hypothetical protein
LGALPYDIPLHHKHQQTQEINIVPSPVAAFPDPFAKLKMQVITSSVDMHDMLKSSYKTNFLSGIMLADTLLTDASVYANKLADMIATSFLSSTSQLTPDIIVVHLSNTAQTNSSISDFSIESNDSDSSPSSVLQYFLQVADIILDRFIDFAATNSSKIVSFPNLMLGLCIGPVTSSSNASDDSNVTNLPSFSYSHALGSSLSLQQLKPKQSFEFIKGVQTNILMSSSISKPLDFVSASKQQTTFHGVLPYVIFHANNTRKDLVTKFSERSCIEQGCNKIIHIRHFMSELAFKLGKYSKYGA